MKTKITILFFLILYGNYSYSQYKSVFGEDTTQWNVTYIIPDMMPTVLYKAFGDTIINEKNYKHLYQGFWYYSADNYDNYGYLREDTTTGKLWFLSLEDNNEQLMMDLSLTKGDTFVFPMDIQYTVDTVYYQDGKKYISFYGYSYESIYFIEGIGPTNFLFFDEVYSDMSVYNDAAELRCKFDDNVLVYHNQEYDNCVDTTVGISEKQINNFIVYPNPAGNFITIQFDNIDKNYPYKIEFYNSMGLRVLERIIDDNEPIYLQNIPSGIYFLRVSTNTELFLSKFIKL